MFKTESQPTVQTSTSEENPLEEFRNQIRAELDQSRKEFDEIKLLIEQSSLEVNKLADHNKSATSDLQRIQSQFDSLPREEIRKIYDAAMDSQQRLFVMRGQLEKLESDKTYLERILRNLNEIRSLLEGGDFQAGRPGSSFAIVEMVIQAQEAERQRISRQMHDGPAQALSNFILQTEIAMRLFDMDPEQARKELGNLKVAATTTFKQVRDFIFELRPMMLDDLGFIPTIKRYVDAMNEQLDLDLNIQVIGPERRLEPYLEVMVFRAIQELLNNAVRHSQASQIRVQIDVSDRDVRTLVDDNGRGFDPQILEEDSGMGLKLIRERVEMLGGEFGIGSVEGQGTQVTFKVPTSGY
jgi:two-component system, NarL family, sensor histidine kinase DegS